MHLQFDQECQALKWLLRGDRVIGVEYLSCEMQQ